jgi:hypothetical protein
MTDDSSAVEAAVTLPVFNRHSGASRNPAFFPAAAKLDAGFRWHDGREFGGEAR